MKAALAGPFALALFSLGGAASAAPGLSGVLAPDNLIAVRHGCGGHGHGHGMCGHGHHRRSHLHH